MLHVDAEKCMGCGLCEAECAFGAIEVTEGTARVGDGCTLCGACVDACEAGALHIERGEAATTTDFDAWRGVWIFAEHRHGRLAPVALELLGAGRVLADVLGVELAAVLLGQGVDEAARDLVAHGADKVYVTDDPALAVFNDEIYAAILEELIQLHKPEIVLAGATAIGRSFIPRVASALATGLTADCTALEIRTEDRMLLQTRPAFGGNVMATIVCPNTRPQMATVRPRVMPANCPDPARSGEIVAYAPSAGAWRTRVRVLDSVVEEQEQANIAEADILVSGGRGMCDAKGFDLIRRLADAVGGGVAASRAAVDAEWIAYPHQVGQTGRTVCPKVYVACGISGAIQHVVGMQSSEMIVAINRDKDAPIFEVATCGVVGDLFEILPALTEKLEQRRKR